MTHTRNAVLSAVLLVVLGGSISACGPDGSSPDSKHPHSTVAASAAPSKQDDSTAQEEDSSTITVALDGTAKWKNGVTVKLSGFNRGVSSDTAAPGSTAYLGFTVTVHNGSKQPLNLSGTTLSCPDGAGEIFDTDNGLSGAPDTHVLAGQSGSWKTACVFQKSATKAQIEVTPATDSGGWYRTAIFTGTVK